MSFCKSKRVVAMRELLDASDLFASNGKTSFSLLCQAEACNPTKQGIQKIMLMSGNCQASFRLNNAINNLQ
jgi:hypothetical protein